MSCCPQRRRGRGCPSRARSASIRPVEPRDVALGGFGGVLHEGPRVGVEPCPRRPQPRRGASARRWASWAAPALEQAQAGLRGQVTGEGQTQAEVAGVVVAAGLLAVEEVGELAAALVGDAVHLAAPPSQARARAPGPEGGPFATQRPGHGDRRRGAPPRILGGPHRARPFETGQRRVQGPERHVGELPQLVAQALADLVAVHGLVLEEAEDGELQHQRIPGTASQNVFITRCIVSIHRPGFNSGQ